MLLFPLDNFSIFTPQKNNYCLKLLLREPVGYFQYSFLYNQK